VYTRKELGACADSDQDMEQQYKASVEQMKNAFKTKTVFNSLKLLSGGVHAVPSKTIPRLFEAMQLRKNQTVFDLGVGVCRLALAASLFTGKVTYGNDLPETMVTIKDIKKCFYDKKNNESPVHKKPRREDDKENNRTNVLQSNINDQQIIPKQQLKKRTKPNPNPKSNPNPSPTPTHKRNPNPSPTPTHKRPKTCINISDSDTNSE
jgi:hypothetical protein